MVTALCEPAGANAEVDAVGWFDLESAARTLTYDRDARLLSALKVREATLRLPA